MEELFAPPRASPSRSERDAVLQERLYQEITARDALNRDSDSLIAAFSAAAAQDPCYDPLFVEFFSDTHAKIAHLTERLEHVRNGRMTDGDIAESRERLESLSPFLVEGPESIHEYIMASEKKTGQLLSQKVPAGLAQLDKELTMNRILKAQLHEAREQKS